MLHLTECWSEDEKIKTEPIWINNSKIVYLKTDDLIGQTVTRIFLADNRRDILVIESVESILIGLEELCGS